MFLTRCLQLAIAAMAILGHSSVQAQRPVALAAPVDGDAFRLELAWEDGSFVLNLEDNPEPFRQLDGESLTRSTPGEIASCAAAWRA